MSITRLALGLALAALVSACGNGTNDAGNLIKALPAAFASLGKTPQPVGVSPEQMTQALQSTDLPVTLIFLEGRQTQFLALEIERNGAYQTYGTSSRQSVAFRNGMITATRGLGGDLMSSGEDALLHMVSRRQSGVAPYTMRFLTSDNRTEALSYNCTVSPGKSVPVKVAEIDTTGVAVTAQCAGAGNSFTNVFVVDRHGSLVSARQWLGYQLGYVTSQPLRR